MTAPVYGTAPASDPTAVMGRRTLAWIADLLLYAVVVAAGFASMGEYVEVPAGIDDPCQVLEDSATARGDDIGACLDFRDMGIEEAEDRVYLLDTSESGVQTLLSLGWFAFFVVLQGLTGGSPGKLLFGLRVVDQHGNRCGIGRSLGRTLLWIVDAAPWLVPIVGPITAFTSTGHRRVGDLAAGTYVVSSSSVGQPVTVGAAAAPGGQQWGAPPPTGPGWGPPATPPPGSWPGSPPPAGPSAPPSAPPVAPTADTGGGGRWTSPISEPTPDLDIRDLEVPEPTERADQAPPSVAADPDWSHTPDLDVEPPPAVQESDAAGGPPADPGAPEWAAPTLPEIEEPATSWQPPTTPGADWPPSDPLGHGAPPSEPEVTGPEATVPEAAPTPEEEPPRPEPAPFAAPGAAAPPTPTTSSAQPEAPPQQPAHEWPAPQWDQARGTYLQWDPNRQAWLQWDDARRSWKPIDT